MKDFSPVAQLDGAVDATAAARIVRHPAWSRIKDAVEAVRPHQAKDGSVDPEDADARKAVTAAVGELRAALAELAPLFPHDAGYLSALDADLARWASDGLGVPDFLDSLLAFAPAADRRNDLLHLVLFPMYTQNGNPNRNLEAVLTRVVWPDWLAELERDRFDNPLFVPLSFVDFTAGYDTNSAVLFPETIAVRKAPERFSWGGIFCDREAARFRTVSTAAVETLGLELPPEARELITDQDLALQTFVLWDLIHDRTHSHGELPFDPFMIKQRNPFWMYALEELRCDLTAFREAVRLEADGYPQGRNVQIAVLFDRMFRFPVTGSRVRNYDGLGGQLLFAHLHQQHVIEWRDNRMTIAWDKVAAATTELLDEIETLYRAGIDRPKIVHWLAAHQLVAARLTPHPASLWAKGADALPFDGPTKELVNAVLPDEFPLSMFYEALAKRLRDVIASTRGITSSQEAA